MLALGALFQCHALGGHAQRAARVPSPPPIITSARVALPDRTSSGPLYVTVGGRERKVADGAVAARVIQGGRKVVYSGRDGAGGYENEGQSLRVYDAAAGRSRKIMSVYYMIDKVTEVTTSTNKTALLVSMMDGGLGASYLAVVDPARGEVFFRRWARLVSRRGDTISIGHYRVTDWEKLHESEGAKVTPYKTERRNLNAILRGRVITNKPSR